MRRTIVTLVILLTLTGCDNSVKHAKAQRINEATRQSANIHDQRMQDKRQLTPARIALLETIIYTSAITGAGLIVITGLAWGWFVLRVSNAEAKKREIFIIKDPQGMTFPVLVKGDDVVNLASGEGFKIGEPREANRMLVESNTTIKISNNRGFEVIKPKQLEG